MEVDQTEKHIVNGGLLKKYVNQSVQVLLKVENTSTGGRQVQGTTTDKKTINVALQEPLRQPLSGWIEVFGTPTDATNVNCSEIIIIPSDENSEPFDEEAHNVIVLAMENMRDFDETGGDGGF